MHRFCKKYLSPYTFIKRVLHVTVFFWKIFVMADSFFKLQKQRKETVGWHLKQHFKIVTPNFRTHQDSSTSLDSHVSREACSKWCSGSSLHNSPRAMHKRNNFSPRQQGKNKTMPTFTYRIRLLPHLQTHEAVWGKRSHPPHFSHSASAQRVLPLQISICNNFSTSFQMPLRDARQSLKHNLIPTKDDSFRVTRACLTWLQPF